MLGLSVHIGISEITLPNYAVSLLIVGTPLHI
uniref:Actin related protein 6 n=1 Tax=Myotis myotis TaxID=51298 RepID=A0A7J7Z080_MYOMY|nr:actin related protein 6 [Myotis myotis]